MPIKGVFKPSDCPGEPDEATRADLARLFASLFPGVAHPEFDENHAGVAIAAHNPKLALGLANLSRLIAVELPWSKRANLRELAIQTVNLRLKSAYSFRARRGAAKAAGLGEDILTALPAWRTSRLFDDEQRLVIEYAEAVVSGEVPAELSSRVVERFGEKGTVEFTAVVSFWSFWALFLNATRPGD